MVDEIRVVNYTNGGTITLNRDDADYLIDDNGLDWGSVKTSFSTIQNLDGVGNTLNAVSSSPREMSITGWVIGTEDEMKVKKTLLSQVFSPHCRIKLFIKNKPPIDPDAPYDEKEYFITVYTSSAVKFGDTIPTNNEVMCRFHIEYYAPYPYFERTKQYTGPGLVQNSGDISVGVYISMSSSGVPYIHIAGPGAFYHFQGLETASSVTIDTRYSARKLIIDGSPGYGNMSPLYDWIEVPVGSVNITGSGDMTIEFNEAYSTMEDL